MILITSDPCSTCQVRLSIKSGQTSIESSVHHYSAGPGSVVAIATSYRLDGPGIESQWRRDFPHLSRLTLGPTQPPVQWAASCTMGTRSFLGVKSCQGVTLTPHPLILPWSWKGRAIPLLPLWPVKGYTLHFYFTTQLQWLKFPYFSSIVCKHMSTVRNVACKSPAAWKISAELIPCQWCRSLTNVITTLMGSTARDQRYECSPPP
jgi:hypothetical protein